MTERTITVKINQKLLTQVRNDNYLAKEMNDDELTKTINDFLNEIDSPSGLSIVLENLDYFNM